MAKIMLVEDDRSLMEIYSIRLRAEGYEVVMAGDGEEALAVAVKEKPDLILSDVMMPKISGFDMLDILRQTPETKGIKVIMMTALSSDDQRKRGESLGADKYLVKSQVGIEDVVRAIHDMLGDKVPVATSTVAADGTTPVGMGAKAPVVEVSEAPHAPVNVAPVVAPVGVASAPVAPVVPTAGTAGTSVTGAGVPTASMAGAGTAGAVTSPPVATPEIAGTADGRNPAE